MRKKIVNYKDLCEEKQRLETLLVVQRQRISSDWNEVKEEFAPVRNTAAFIGQFVKKDKSNPLINVGVDLVGDVLIRRLLLAKADWVSRLILPFFFKNYSSNVLNKGMGKSLFGSVRKILKRKMKKKKTEDEANPEWTQY